MRLRIYLSHPPGLRGEIIEWAKELEKRLHVKIWIPFQMKTRDITLLESGTLKPYSKQEIIESKKLVEANLRAIKNCDLLIAVLPYPSIGVIMEICYSGFVLQKPTLVLTYMKGHPWLSVVARIYDTKESIVSEIRKIRDVLGYKY